MHRIMPAPAPESGPGCCPRLSTSPEKQPKRLPAVAKPGPWRLRSQANWDGLYAHAMAAPCCGRETLPKPRLVRLGGQRVEDPHHPRGYRELRSPAEMRTLLKRKVRKQAGICEICHEEFTEYNDIATD